MAVATKEKSGLRVKRERVPSSTRSKGASRLLGAVKRNRLFEPLPEKRVKPVVGGDTPVAEVRNGAAQGLSPAVAQEAPQHPVQGAQPPTTLGFKQPSQRPIDPGHTIRQPPTQNLDPKFGIRQPPTQNTDRTAQRLLSFIGKNNTGNPFNNL